MGRFDRLESSSSKAEPCQTGGDCELGSREVFVGDETSMLTMVLPVELIAVGDGSTERTEEIARIFEDVNAMCHRPARSSSA